MTAIFLAKQCYNYVTSNNNWNTILSNKTNNYVTPISNYKIKKKETSF